MRAAVGWMERHQVPLYLAGLAGGGALGLTVPGVADPAETAILPVLALLLYATFLGVPFAGLVEAVRDRRFLVTVLLVNFLVVPAVAWALSRVVAHDVVLLVGVLFVLLTPCIDYVMVFTGLAGGGLHRLLAAAPALMLAQILLLPLFLWAFVGGDFVGAVELGPFVEAFGLLIVAPLIAAGLTQYLATRTTAGRVWENAVASAMVPLMVVTLFVVVASQISAMRAGPGSLLLVGAVYVAFIVIMVPAGMLLGRAARLDVPGRRALVFSGVTRNSLVVLPLVLALPPGFELAPLVVVSQTLVELVAMVILVKLVPVLVPGPGRTPG